MTAQTRPGIPARARRRLRLLRNRIRAALPGRQGEIERTVIDYNRGRLAPPPRATELDQAGAVRWANAMAAELRSRGVARPVVVATFPGFHENPYGQLMELAYARNGLIAVHVESVDAITAVVSGAVAGGYRAVVHLNSADRFVPRAHTQGEADEAVAAAVVQIDDWLGLGAGLITTIHYGQRLAGFRASAERRIAQAIADRASLVHVLTARTSEALADWIVLDSRRVHHAPHPRFDTFYGPLGERGPARAALGLDPGAPSRDVLVGLLGTLVHRKGAAALIDAYADVPEVLPDGRRVRLLLGGSIAGTGGEELIRRAMADQRTIVRFGFLADADLLGLMAALDAAVVPYDRFVNSSWLHLALTLGVPVIAPAGPTVEEVVPPEALRTFASGDRVTLARALVAAGELTTQTARQAARNAVSDLDPDAISEGFVQALLAATRER